MSFEKQQQSYIAHVSPKTMKMGRSASLETRTTAGLDRLLRNSMTLR